MRQCVFKIAYSTRSFSASFPTDISYHNFVHELNIMIQRHFGFQQFIIINGEYTNLHPEYTGIVEDAPCETMHNIHRMITSSNANILAFYVKNMESCECMICYDPINTQSQTNTLYYFQCSHTFCIHCINQCIQHNQNLHCPVCRNQRVANRTIINERPIVYYGNMMIVDMRTRR